MIATVSSTTPTPRRGTDAGIALLLAAGAAALLLATRALDQTGDSLAYAYAIKSGWRMFHPHHLLFAPIVRLAYLPLAALAGIDAVLAAQLHNVLWAAVGVAAVYALVARSAGSRAIGAAAGIALLAARGFEVYATQVEVYVPAAGCAALLLLAVVRESRTWTLASLLALLVFYHQSNVLFCIPLLLLLGRGSGRGGLRRGIRAVAAAGAVVLATYVAVYLLQPGPASVRGFFDYTLRYAVGPYSAEWGAAENLGGGGVAAALASQLWCIAEPTDGAAGRATAVVALAALVLWSVLCVARRRGDERLRAAVLAWLAVYEVFYVWWQPGQREFFVIMLVPLVLLLGLALGDAARLVGRPRAAPVVAVLLIALSVGAVIPRQLTRTLLPAHRTRGLAPEVARTYVDFAPDCIQLNGRLVTLALRYYYDFTPDRSMNVKLYRRRFVRPEWRAPLDDLPAAGCLVIPLAEVLPPGETDRAHDDPVGWFDYYRWLFRIEIEGDRVRVRPVTLSKPPGAPELVVQRGAPAAFAGMSGLFESLRGAGRLAALGEWLEANRAVLDGKVDPVLLGPERE